LNNGAEEISMSRSIRLLQVEDSESDALLIVRQLCRGGFEVEAERVETEEKMREALAAGVWDLVIADYRLPNFSAPDALRVLQEVQPDLPFLVVSGVMGEEVAVQMMKAGAQDYLLKDRLERLPPAVERELQEAELRREHREADRKLRIVCSELETLYAHTPVLMYVVNEKLCVEKMNDVALRYTGSELEASLGHRICELTRCMNCVEAGGKDSASCPACPFGLALEECFKTGARHESLEVWSMPHGTMPGTKNCLLFSICRMPGAERSTVLVCAQNVTQLKDAERSLERIVDSLRSALAEKAVLFQEVHHRVKNNLQIIASLLAMKARMKKEKVSIEDLKDCQQRVLSMAMIHDQLYSQKEVHQIDFAAFIRELAPALVAAYDRQSTITLKLDLKPVELSIDQSIPCGLILNELITNAVKYAYPQGKGEIAARLSSDADMVFIEVADKGTGLPADAQVQSAQTLGMQLIHSLTKQLKGRVELSTPPGLAVKVAFPALQAQSRSIAVQ
jgi:two-component sensor histidine kinase